MLRNAHLGLGGAQFDFEFVELSSAGVLNWPVMKLVVEQLATSGFFRWQRKQ